MSYALYHTKHLKLPSYERYLIWAAHVRIWDEEPNMQIIASFSSLKQAMEFCANHPGEWLHLHIEDSIERTRYIFAWKA